MKQILQVQSDILKRTLDGRLKALDNQIKEFKRKYVNTKVDKFGNEDVKYNPYAITVFFFKSLNPSMLVEPDYSAEQLSWVWECFMEIITNINMEIGAYTPTISTFAKFSGLSVERMRGLKDSDDECIKALANKIFDEVYNSNIMLSQTKDLTAGATQYRMKYENEAITKNSPTVNVSIKAKELDLTQLNSKIAEAGRILESKTNYEGK